MGTDLGSTRRGPNAEQFIVRMKKWAQRPRVAACHANRMPCHVLTVRHLGPNLNSTRASRTHRIKSTSVGVMRRGSCTCQHLPVCDQTTTSKKCNDKRTKRTHTHTHTHTHTQLECGKKNRRIGEMRLTNKDCTAHSGDGSSDRMAHTWCLNMLAVAYFTL